MRRALYYRLHSLRALLGRPAVASLLRFTGWVLLLGWLAFVSLVLFLRFVVLPSVADYRSDIERIASSAISQPVRIASLSAHWRGLNPELVFDGVSLLDAAGETALTLERVDTVLSWHSLWRLKPVFSLLALERPVLQVRRDVDGRISVAGMASADGGDDSFAEWVLAQLRIRIIDATLVWEDAQRGAPPLVLEDVQFALDNSGRKRRFGLSAMPPAALAARIDLRGEIQGDLNEALENYAGKLYLEVDYADLAGWQAWIDYPVHLPRGRGALRLWGNLAEGKSELTADLSLADLRIRLADQLPPFDLQSLRGRVSGSYSSAAWQIGAQRLELQTDDGLQVTPTDFHLDWQPQADGVRGSFRANRLDLTVLRKLSAHLPLDARSRELLAAHAPAGSIDDLKASWTLQGDRLLRYALAARFAGLGVAAESYFPGAAGLAGKIDLNEQGGHLWIDADKSTLSLPAVFPEPEIVFDALNAKIGWKNHQGVLDLAIEQVNFSGPDAHGSARGRYRYRGDGPGEIDLEASIEEADGRAVWRYMPHAVNEDARLWLKHGITAGTAHDARLVLKGDLRDFPFRDPASGTFLVTAKARDTRIDYADGWPVIEGVTGDMEFDYGMRVHAKAGRILGAQLPDVKVTIPDFDVEEEMLLVRGAASGPTQAFLEFIERSPVAESIDHFTEGMRAIGQGRLDLELDIPLRRPLETRMRGTYQFQDNQVHLLDGLPMISQVNGRLDLTDSSITAEGITGRGFGGPLRVKVASEAGRVSVNAGGTAVIGEVARHFGWPLLDSLSGSSPWKADMIIHRRNAYVLVTSDLQGISSPLPEPFNKSASERMALRIERTMPAGGEQYRINLGDSVGALLLSQNGRWTRGAVVVGAGEPTLPAQGFAVRVALPKVDADAWRRHLPASDATESQALPLPLSALSLRTPTLQLFGAEYHEVELDLAPALQHWAIDLKTREAAGALRWQTAGDGWLEGRLQRLHLPASMGEGEGEPTVIDRLPGMNLQIDDLRLGDKALGQLDVRARNMQGAWRLDRLRLSNPDAELTGSGLWTRGARPRTDLDFELGVKDIGKLLSRLGYADAVRQGKAQLAGSLRWQGPLTRIHYPTLTGSLDVRADKGQFNKLEPGVGRLLGLISLQSLPRRLTLDFRDLFSEGLAFDRIEGKLAVERGVMQTVSALTIDGPAAQVSIEGSTDLQQETQNLQVVVRPEVSMLAVGAATLVNPVAGAAALVANTVLKSPLNRALGYRYRVTGTWSDPLVEKVGLGESSKPDAVQE